MTKKRKSLNDVLAQQFVYGESSSSASVVERAADLPLPETQPPQPQAPSSESKTELSPQPQSQKSGRSSLINKFQRESKEPTKRFTIDLAESLHRKLALLCARTGRSKADIVRMLLEEALQDVED